MKMKTCNTCKYMLRNIDDLDASTPLERLGTCQIMLPPFVTVKNSDRQVDIDRITCSLHEYEDCVESIFK